MIRAWSLPGSWLAWLRWLSTPQSVLRSVPRPLAQLPDITWSPFVVHPMRLPLAVQFTFQPVLNQCFEKLQARVAQVHLAFSILAHVLMKQIASLD